MTAQITYLLTPDEQAELLETIERIKFSVHNWLPQLLARPAYARNFIKLYRIDAEPNGALE